jgi:hypothetical protein
MSLRSLVADLCSSAPTTTPWWVLSLVEELPDTAAYAGSLAGGREYRGWGWDRHVMAALFDAIQVNTVVTARVAGAKNVKPPAPMPRPGEKNPSGGTPMRTLMRAHADAFRARRSVTKRGG